MAVHQIHGQAVTFTPSGCEDFCLMLVNGATEDFTPETSFCFQMPLFNDGSNLLSLTGDAVDYVADFNNTTSYNRTDNLTTVACGSPYVNQANINAAAPTVANAISGTGKWFWDLTLGDISITWGLNDADDTSKELLFDIHGASEFPLPVYPTLADADTRSFTASDANTSMLITGTETWDSSVDDPVEVYIRAKSECDDTDEHVEYDVDVNGLKGIPNFLETTFTAANDTFYRLTYDLSKCSASTVKIYDSASVLIFQADSNGVNFDKIFKTGTLPTTTVTVRFEIADLTDYPNTDYNLDVLTNVSLLKQCSYEVTIETDAAVNVATLGETHDTTTEQMSTVSYHQNIEYCLDTTYAEGCYQFRATNSCDGTDDYVSNCFTICSDNCDSGIEKQLSWDVDSVKCVGDDTIDGVAYPSTGFMWLKMDLQDPTYEEEREQYISSAGGLVTPWTQHRETEILVIWPVPPFVRRTIATAMMDTFYIDGVAYQKFDDDPYSPLFSARHNSAMRITVAKVGQHTTSKNV